MKRFLRSGGLAAALLVVSCRGAFDVDPVVERTDAQEICRLDGKWLSPSGPGNRPLVGSSIRFAMVSAGQNNWLVDSSNCALQEVHLSPKAATERIEFAALSDLTVLFTANGARDLPVALVRLDLLTGELNRLRLYQSEHAVVQLEFSDDGRRAVWITDSGTEQEQVHSGPVGEPRPQFSFSPGTRLGVDTYQLVDVDRSAQQILLQRSSGEYLLVDAFGSLIRTFRPDDGILPRANNVRFSLDGNAYLAWDDSQEPSIVQWRIDDATIRKDLPKHSRVVSAAVSSDWKWLAVSIQANTKSGRGIESLTVWSVDGAVRFHKKLRPGARTPVVFLDGDLVGYSEVDEQWHATTHIVRLTSTSPSLGGDEK